MINTVQIAVRRVRRVVAIAVRRVWRVVAIAVRRVWRDGVCFAGREKASSADVGYPGVARVTIAPQTAGVLLARPAGMV